MLNEITQAQRDIFVVELIYVLNQAAHVNPAWFNCEIFEEGSPRNMKAAAIPEDIIYEASASW